MALFMCVITYYLDIVVEKYFLKGNFLLQLVQPNSIVGASQKYFLATIHLPQVVIHRIM